MPTVRRFAIHARILWLSSPGLAALCAVITLLVAIASTGVMLSTGQLVSSVSEALDHSRATGRSPWFWFGLTAFLFLFTPVAASALTAVGQALSGRYLAFVMDRLSRLGAAPETLSHLEDPTSKADLDKLATAPADWLFIAGVQATWTLLAARLTGLGALIVVAFWSWYASLAVALGWLLVSRWFGRWSATIFDDLLDVTGKDRRRAEYFRRLLLEPAPAKEVRLFDLSQWILARYMSAWHESMSVVWRNRDQKLARSLGVLLVALAANAGAIILLGRDAWQGLIQVGELTVLAQAILALSALGPQVDAQTSLARTTAVAAELDRQWEAQTAVRVDPAVRPVRVEDRIAPADRGPRQVSNITIRGVTYTYPHAESRMFEDFSLEVPARQALAIVGINGIGKSTLIKLVCGLYQPSAGQILIGGREPAAARSLGDLSVIQQHFVRYHLTLTDNVAAGAIGCRDDPDLLRQALRDAGGASLLEDLPHGWGTVLSPEYTDGVDLSGGQWQRVALARAFTSLRAGASVLILDEPTSSLDTRAEAALFDRFLDLTADATTLLVTHRLSSVRRADRIIVLDRDEDGPARIVEDGSHDSLMSENGLYARLFSAQAARFADAPTPGARL